MSTQQRAACCSLFKQWRSNAVRMNIERVPADEKIASSLWAAANCSRSAALHEGGFGNLSAAKNEILH